jgi:hypothetical protein
MRKILLILLLSAVCYGGDTKCMKYTDPESCLQDCRCGWCENENLTQCLSAKSCPNGNNQCGNISGFEYSSLDIFLIITLCIVAILLLGLVYCIGIECDTSKFECECCKQYGLLETV